MQCKEFKLRRETLLKNIDNKGIVIVFSAKKCCENHPYRQNSDFYYLTGFNEPDSIAVLIPHPSRREFILFSRKSDPLKERWDGPYIGQEKACAKFGAHQAFAISDIDSLMPQLLKNRTKLYSNVSPDGNFDPKITAWLTQSPPDTKPPQLIHLDQLLHKMRRKKDQLELNMIRKAAEVTTLGFLRAMSSCAPHKYEFELAAEIIYEFTRLGGHQPAFPTIVASGLNACTLHYELNNCLMKSGDLVLLDAGAEYEHYAADVSRTFPINGKFTHKQRTIYEIVLAAQTETIKQIRPGISCDQLQATTERTITAGLREAKLLRGNLEDLINQQSYKPFFMHRVSHWLGLDTHDVGEKCPLEPGMVLTIEPGIYDHQHLKMGIRIEDDILVTDQGYEVLTAEIPKKVAEIEKIMQKRPPDIGKITKTLAT